MTNIFSVDHGMYATVAQYVRSAATAAWPDPESKSSASFALRSPQVVIGASVLSTAASPPHPVSHRGPAAPRDASQFLQALLAG